MPSEHRRHLRRLPDSTLRVLAREGGATLMLTYLNGNGYIDVDRAMAFVILAAVIAYGLGKIHTEGKTVKLMQELHVAEQEVEDLREFIWLTSLSAPAAPVDVTAQALPNPSPVERLRHHNSQQGGALA